MAIKTLAELQSDIEAHEAAATPGSASEAIWGVLAQLCQTLQNKPPGPTTDAETIKKLNDTINWQAGILQQIKEALEAGDEVTVTQLPLFAKSILAWAKTGEKPL